VWGRDYSIIAAKDYTDEAGVLKLEELQGQDGAIAHRQPVLEQIMSFYAGPPSTKKKIIVNFGDVVDCDPPIYTHLTQITNLPTGPGKDFALFVTVDKDSNVYRGLIKAKFPEDYIKIKKKNKIK